MIKNPLNITENLLRQIFNMKKVELLPAFLWLCDNCGTDQFERAIVCEFSKEELQELKEEWGIKESDTGHFLEGPKTVTCEFCQEEFETESFESDQC